MPNTVLNWLTDTSRPRDCGGAISAIYIGETTEAPPMASPPIKRKRISEIQSQAKPQPTAETKKSTARTNRVRLRPIRSAHLPTAIEPGMVPIKALATENPN